MVNSCDQNGNLLPNLYIKNVIAAVIQRFYFTFTTLLYFILFYHSSC